MQKKKKKKKKKKYTEYITWSQLTLTRGAKFVCKQTAVKYWRLAPNLGQRAAFRGAVAPLFFFFFFFFFSCVFFFFFFFFLHQVAYSNFEQNLTDNIQRKSYFHAAFFSKNGLFKQQERTDWFGRTELLHTKCAQWWQLLLSLHFCIHIWEYHIRPNYRTVRLVFSKLLGTLICGKICIYLLRIHYKKIRKRTYLMMIMWLFLIFFIKAYVVGTHLNCIDNSMQFKWVPT